MEHALTRVAGWAARWREAGRLVMLLDFDGTLAPIVERPELAGMPEDTRSALNRLRALPGVELAVVSGRELADARERAGIEGIVYAGNHGMEIEGPGVRRVHAAAAAARPLIEELLERLEGALAGIEGAFVEDKRLTLSVHYRLAARADVPTVRRVVARAVEGVPGVRVTEGKEVLEVRPRVEWDKGRAVEFLLDYLAPPPGTPAVYIGDDRTDEDAFRALARRQDRPADGVIVADPPPPGTAATCYLRNPGEVATLLRLLADMGHAAGPGSRRAR